MEIYFLKGRLSFNMRIISGNFKGTTLFTLTGDNTRPTLDRVKESLFNILGNTFYDIFVLDLFAGSGALGLEAVSRGASFCDFVDISNDAVNIINKNIDKCHAKEVAKVHKTDFDTAIKKFPDNRFDLVFLDPPYGKDMGILAINKLDRIVKDTGIVILETDYTDDVPDDIGNFTKYDSRKYGRVVISFFRKAGFIDGGT